MASTIYRPCYATREEVMRALDIKAAAYSSQQVDRKINAASDAVDAMCQRVFFPTDGTNRWDWPNYQYTYPWKLYFDQLEMAAQPTLVVTGSLLEVPVVIPSGNYIMEPVNEGPPFTWIELRRDLNSAFGSNDTPQLDIAITGTFGYWTKTTPVGMIAAAIADDVVTTVQMSAGPLAGAGTGDVLIVDAERMLVTDSQYVSTGITPISGCTSKSAADNTMVVADGTQFSPDEIILYDSELMLVQTVMGNNLIVKRAWSGSALATHSGSDLWANRLLTVQRGALGTTATSHTSDTNAYISTVPGLVKDVAIATALTGVANEPAAYAVQMAASWYGSNPRLEGSQRESAPGIGLPGLVAQLTDSIYVRKARSRVI
jgi:hypothetical protein